LWSLYDTNADHRVARRVRAALWPLYDTNADQRVAALRPSSQAAVDFARGRLGGTNGEHQH